MKLRVDQFAVPITQLPLSLGPVIALSRAHHLGKIQTSHVGSCFGFGDGLINQRLRHRLPCCQAHDGTVLRTLAAQQTGQLAGVNVGDGNRFFTHKILRERFG
ncbi:hypothetical protein D3C87_1774920 [compost metagenome]